MSIQFGAVRMGLLCAVPALFGLAWGATVDLSKAVILVAEREARNVEAAKMLQLEIERRTGIALDIAHARPPAGIPVIALGKAGAFLLPVLPPEGIEVPNQPEGYAVWVDRPADTAPTVYIVGRDDKGALFGAGYLLRKLYMTANYLHVDEALRQASAPRYPLRGHQIISRSQNNESFVDWYDIEDLKQYVRDLAIFGNNTIEPTTETNDFLNLSEYCEALDIDLAYTVNCDVIIDLNAKSDDEIRQWLSDIQGIDQFVTYGGDHGGARPPFYTFPAMERVVPLVLESHPGAEWWYSNQCMGGESTSHAFSYDHFTFAYLQEKQPPWLAGLIYGPWTRGGIADVRAKLPAQYRIRHYPDICHVRWCQYPVPKWDRPWAQVWERAKNIYAMPRMMRAVHNAWDELTIGSTAYNHTGATNDLNKFTFTAMDWDPDTALEEFVRDYARVFIAYQFQYPAPSPEAIEEATGKVARALFGLEDNWTGHLASNPSPEKCLQAWKDIVALMGGPEKVESNWRVDMFLTRALIDALVKRKYDAERKYQEEAYAALRQAPIIGLQAAIDKARAALARIDTEFPSKENAIEEMKSWGISDGYGDLDDTLTFVYQPLSDRGWIEAQLDAAQSLEDIDRIVNYEDPGPGGFYDDLGDEGRQPHLVRTMEWEDDPGFVYSPFNWNDHAPGTTRRQSHHNHAVARYDTPLVMRWEGLDPNAQYYIEFVSDGPFDPEFRCDTDEGFEVHRVRTATGETPARYDIPAAATRDGVLQLEWRLMNTVRGVSIAEIWLKKVQ